MQCILWHPLRYSHSVELAQEVQERPSEFVTRTCITMWLPGSTRIMYGHLRRSVPRHLHAWLRMPALMCSFGCACVWRKQTRIHQCMGKRPHRMGHPSDQLYNQAHVTHMPPMSMKDSMSPIQAVWPLIVAEMFLYPRFRGVCLHVCVRVFDLPLMLQDYTHRSGCWEQISCM